MINLSNSAREKIAEIQADGNNPKFRVRAFVQGGGCLDIQHRFTLDENDDPDNERL